MGCNNTKEEDTAAARNKGGTSSSTSREKQKEVYRENGGPLEKGSLNSRTGPKRTSSQYNPLGDSISGHGDSSSVRMKGSVHSVESGGLRLTKGALGDADKRLTKLEREQRREEKANASTLGRVASIRDLGSPKGRRCKDGADLFSNDNGSVNGAGGGLGEGGSEGSHGAAPSISDRESTFTTDSMLDKIGKKVNRPRSAKGHSAPEPSPEAMADRIRCHAMKGLLYDIDESVEPATMITSSNWEKLLVEKRQKVKQAKEAGLGESAEDSVPGLVGLVNVNNQTDDKTLDDVLSLMSYFPVRGGGRSVTDRQNSNTLNNTVPNLNLNGVPDTKSEGSDDEGKLEDLTDDENGLRRTSFLVLPDNSPRPAQEEFTAVGRFHFSENGKRVNKYYERQVKPWILDYFFGKEAIDPTLVPIGLVEPPASLIHSATSPAFNKTHFTPGGYSSTSIPDHSQSPGSNGGNSSVVGGHASYFEQSAKDPLASRTTNDSGDGGMTNSAGPPGSHSQLGLASRPSWGQGTGGTDAHSRALANQQMGEEEVIGMLI